MSTQETLYEEFLRRPVTSPPRTLYEEFLHPTIPLIAFRLFPRLPIELQIEIFKSAFFNTPDLREWIDCNLPGRPLWALHALGRDVKAKRAWTFWEARWSPWGTEGVMIRVKKPSHLILLGKETRLHVPRESDIHSLLHASRPSRLVALETWKELLVRHVGGKTGPYADVFWILDALWRECNDRLSSTTAGGPSADGEQVSGVKEYWEAHR